MRLQLACFVFSMIGAYAASDYLMLRQLIPESKVSQRRFVAFTAQMTEFGIPYQYITGRKSSDRLRALNEDYLGMIELGRHSNYSYVILGEDDSWFHPSFPRELELTRAAAPNFEILSLCNGNLWGRASGPGTPFGTPVFDHEIYYNETDPTGRVYTTWPKFRHARPHNSDIVWPGSPVCIMVRNDNATWDLLAHYIRNNMQLPPDLILRNLQLDTGRITLTANPQLCIEQEFGKV